MVGLGSDSRPQNSKANNRHSFVLNKGELVEVSSDEDGFRGAWYLATIVDSPPKFASKKRKRVMVEYKTLVKEDFSPLVEPVDPVLIRPLPPKDSNTGFQENDVVEAGYRDGWWTGIVRKVLDGSRYRVYFDNPPDVMDFDGKDLRTHWEWVNGNWASSEKQQTTGSIFSSGTEVEVNSEKENARDAWFPAVVVKENEDGTFLVKYQSSGNNDEDGTKVAVDFRHIRPIPPHYADRNYELLEKVDVPYNSGWRAGLITKLLAGKRYNVFFEQGNEDKEHNHSEIRPHAEWVDGQWICKSKVASQADKILIRIKELPEKSMHQKSLVLHRQKLDIVTKRGKSTRFPFGSSQVAARSANTTSQINKSENSKEAGTPLVNALEATVPGEEKLKIMRNQEKNLNDFAGAKIVGLNQQTPAGSSQRRKRGRPRKLVFRKVSGTGKDDGNRDVADKNVIGEHPINVVEVPIQKAEACRISQVAVRERANEVSLKNCRMNEVDKAIPILSIDVEDEDQPLSMWIGGMHSSANAEDSRLSSAKPEKRRDLEQEMVPRLNEASGDDGTPNGNQCLPFAKRSMVWKTIESMDIFQIAPQNPHFQPLADCKEEYREGSAIGVMVTFANLFDKITLFQYDEPESVLESTLESLVFLERHGFDVRMPRDRVNQLILIKDGKEKLLSESKNAEEQIKDHSDERRKLDASAKDIEKKIAVLQEELVATKSKMENKDHDIARLQALMNSVNVQINNARSRFEKVARAPWK